jgi:hypothetical protein
MLIQERGGERRFCSMTSHTQGVLAGTHNELERHAWTIFVSDS